LARTVECQLHLIPQAYTEQYVYRLVKPVNNCSQPTSDLFYMVLFTLIITPHCSDTVNVRLELEVEMFFCDNLFCWEQLFTMCTGILSCVSLWN